MYTVNYYDVMDQEVVLPLPVTTANVDIFGLLHLLERHSKASIVSASIGNKVLDVPNLMRSLKFR